MVRKCGCESKAVISWEDMSVKDDGLVLMRNPKVYRFIGRIPEWSVLNVMSILTTQLISASSRGGE